MANLSDITFNVGISISEETVQRCCQLLSIYLKDHPDKEVVTCSGTMYGTDEYTVNVYVHPKQDREKGGSE